MRGFNKSLRGIPAAIIVVLDNDDRDCIEFEKELRGVAVKNMIKVDYAFCIAIEEVEAWLLGDEAAILRAYPGAKNTVLHSYRQDSICGTWETLADAIYPGGYEKMRKECPTYCERGKYKTKWSMNIGAHMDINNNRSPSFNHFIEEVTKRIHQV